MNDRPYVLIAILFGALVAAMAAAWYFGTAQRSPIAATTATQTFRAKPGTQRDAAKALVSSREHETGKEGTRSEPVEVWGRLGEPGTPESPRSTEETLRLADEVLEDLGAEEGLAVLEVELETSGAPSALYAAMAVLYARALPYDAQRVEDAFALALSTARTPEERLNAVYRHAKVLLERGEHRALLDLLERTRPEAATFSTRAAEIEIMRANAMWAVSDVPGATAALESLLSRDEIPALLERPKFERAYRLAATRLIRMYRETGNDEGAEAVSRKVRSTLRDY